MQRAILIDESFAPGPIGAGLARRKFATFERELPVSVYANVRLLISQLVTDAHWHPSAATAPSLSMRVERHETFVRVSLTDIAPHTRENTTEQLDANQWQVFLLDEMSDRWGILSDSTSDVWFEVDTLP